MTELLYFIYTRTKDCPQVYMYMYFCIGTVVAVCTVTSYSICVFDTSATVSNGAQCIAWFVKGHVKPCSLATVLQMDCIIRRTYTVLYMYLYLCMLFFHSSLLELYCSRHSCMY